MFNENGVAYLPELEKKVIRWSMSEDEKSHESLIKLCQIVNKPRAVCSRDLMHIGLWMEAKRLGCESLAQEVEDILIKQGVNPSQFLVTKKLTQAG